MKLLTFSFDGIDKIGVLGADGSVFSIEDVGIFKRDMNELICNLLPAEREKITALSKLSGGLEYAKLHKRPPIVSPNQDVICLGINYMDHAEESYRFKKIEFDGKREFPIYFSKRVNEFTADGDKIASYAGVTMSLDYECELAFIVAKDAKNIDKSEADEYIFGWCIMNDISARDIQNRHKQWYFGKSFDGFAPLGPWIVTSDEIDTSNLDVKCYINGELRQNSNTRNMIFDASYILSDLSRAMTIKAGSIISLGTPSGVGMGFTPPKFLKSGDKIECEIEKIGKLINEIV